MTLAEAVTLVEAATAATAVAVDTVAAVAVVTVEAIVVARAPVLVEVVAVTEVQDQWGLSTLPWPAVSAHLDADSQCWAESVWELARDWYLVTEC